MAESRSFTFLVEGAELLQCKRKCIVQASTLDELKDSLITQLDLASVPALYVEIYDKEFEDYVALDQISLVDESNRAKLRVSVPKVIMGTPGLVGEAHTGISAGETTNNKGTWTGPEKQAFEAGLRAYGKDWKKIKAMIPTRTLTQIRSHAQKHFKKVEEQSTKGTEAKPVLKQEPGLGAVGMPVDLGGGLIRDLSSSQKAAAPPPPPKRHATSKETSIPLSELGAGTGTAPGMSSAMSLSDSLSGLSLSGSPDPDKLISAVDSHFAEGGQAANLSLSGMSGMSGIEGMSGLDGAWSAGLLDSGLGSLSVDMQAALGGHDPSSGSGRASKSKATKPATLVSTTADISEKELDKLESALNAKK